MLAPPIHLSMRVAAGAAILACLTVLPDRGLAQTSDCLNPEAAPERIIAACTEDLSGIIDRRHNVALIAGQAAALFRLGRSDEALPLFEEVLAYAPENPEYWRYLAVAHGTAKERPEVLAARAMAARLAPERIDLRLDLAQAWREIGNPAQCLAIAGEVLHLLEMPEHQKDAGMLGWTWHIRGQCEATQGDHAAALLSHRSAMTFGGNMANFALGLAQANAHLGERAQAMVLLDQILAPEVLSGLPASVELAARYLRMDLLAAAGEAEALREELDRLADGFRARGVEWQTDNIRAWTMFLLGDAAAADKAAEPLRQRLVESGTLATFELDTLANVDLIAGRPDLARERFREVAHRDPETARGWTEPLAALGWSPLSDPPLVDEIIELVDLCIERLGPACDLRPATARPK